MKNSSAQPVGPARDALEQLVRERTQELLEANIELQESLTELEIAEEELREQNEQLAMARLAVEAERRRYQALFEFAPEGYLVTDLSGIIRKANLAIANQLNTSQEFLVGKPLILYIHERDRRKFHSQLERLNQSSRSAYFEDWETRIQPRDSPAYTAAVTVSTFVEAEGEPPGFLWLIHNITRRKQAEAALREAHAEQEELETRVQERTGALLKANQELQVEVLERKRIEEQLRIQATAVEAAANGIIITNLNGCIEWCNQAFLEMTGYRFEEVLEQNPSFLNSGRHPKEFFQTLWDTILSGKVWHGETINRRKDGILYIEEQTITPVVNEMGEITHFIAIKQDISERKRAEELIKHNAARAENQRLLAEALAQAAAALNASLDLDEVLDLILDQTLRVVPGYGANIMFLKGDFAHIARFRGYQDPSKSVSALQAQAVALTPNQKRMIATGEPVLVPDTSQDPDWVSFPAQDWLRSYAGVPLRSEGNTIGFLNVDSDVPGFFGPGTLKRLGAISAHAVLAIRNARLYRDLEMYLKQEQDMRSQLIQAEKYSAMGRMVASVTHELNNPLQTIKNCLFLVKQDLATGETAHDHLEMATAETQRISELVSQLREIYRPKVTSALGPVELGKVLEDILALLTPHLERQRVKCQLSPGPGLLYVNGIADQLKQVFLNICFNAIEAMQPSGGILLVGMYTDPDARRVGVVFKDNGPGILPENMTKIFDPFFTTKESGTGLGLSISFEIVQRHSGLIDVETKPGQGATFTVWLPLIQYEP